MIPTPETISRARAILGSIESLQSELAALFGGSRLGTGGPAAASKPAKAGGRKRKMSAEGRARIAAAAKARWAKFRAENQKKDSKE